MTKPKPNYSRTGIAYNSDIETERERLRTWNRKLDRRQQRLKHREVSLHALLRRIRLERDGDTEPTQLKLIPEYIPVEFLKLRNVMLDLRDRDTDKAHHLIAAVLDNANYMTEQLLEECRRDEMRKRGNAA